MCLLERKEEFSNACIFGMAQDTASHLAVSLTLLLCTLGEAATAPTLFVSSHHHAVCCPQ